VTLVWKTSGLEISDLWFLDFGLPMTSHDCKTPISPRVLFIFYAFQGADEHAPVSQSGTYRCGAFPGLQHGSCMALRYKKRLTESTKVDLIITLPTHHRLVLLGYHQQFLMADPVGHLPFTLGDEATRPRLYESIFMFFFRGRGRKQANQWECKDM